MKKLLSICFLSMLLGLLSFGVRAQSDDGCINGFWIENLQPDTIDGVVNMPPTGKLPLTHTLGTGHLSQNTGVLLGNATLGSTELYELHFCRCGDLDPKTKVSIDWVLLRADANEEWVEVNDNLSSYVDFDIYTFYNQLNQYGECQSIRWLGGRVNDGFGYCDPVSGTYTLLDSIYGLNTPCRDPNNYPGAMEPTHGTPYSVLTHMGIVPAAGQVNIYSQNHDFFYLDFFEQTRNIVVLKWKQVGNYKLVMRVRQRLGGTDWNNEYWKVNPDGTLSQTDYIGGHQSCCGPVLAEDTIGYPIWGDKTIEVCDGTDTVYGRPPYTFSTTMEDTLVVFGDTMFNGATCSYFHVDSINRFHFYERVVPEVIVDDSTICWCDDFDKNSLYELVTVSDTGINAPGIQNWQLEWSLTPEVDTSWKAKIPQPGDTVGTYYFYVRQTNFYLRDTCTGPIDTITLTIQEIPAPTVTPNHHDFCREDTTSTITLVANRGEDDHCSNTSVWFSNGDSVYTGDTYIVNLAAIRPKINHDSTVTYTVKAYNENNECYSVDSSTVTITFHQTPEINLVYLNPICPHIDGVDFAMQISSTQTEFPYTVAQVSDFAADYTDTLNGPSNQQFTTYNKPYSKITDFLCGNTYHLYYTVTDANGCSVKDTATFVATDTENPVVNPATWTTTLNQCNFEAGNIPAPITTLAGFNGLTLITDNCGIDHWTHKDTTYVHDTCENIFVRTYTFYDYCNNTATFTQTYIAHDSIAPYFVGISGRPIYERLEPKRGENCTFNSLSKAEFVAAFLGKVQDNCVEYDYDYLFEHAEFYWENSIRFGHVPAYDSLDIFREFNEEVWVDGNKQLTIQVVVTDDCGNAADTLAFWFEPDSLVLEPAITIDPDRICLGDTSYLTFDSTKVSYTHYDLAHPLSFEWGSADADINFDDVHSVNTFVVPGTGNKTYHVNMTVRDAYGCEVSSDSVELYVKAAPVMKIIPVTEYGLQPPYCPTIGTVHLVAVSAIDSTFVPNLSYVWTSSQSLDVSARGDTTRLYVIPDSCSYIYDAQVFVTDTIYGCTAEASIDVPVEDQAPSYIGGPHFDTAYVGPGCIMTVSDFTHYVTPSTINNICGWGFDRYTIWQEPAVGTEITDDINITPVYVYIKTPCGEDTVKILDMFGNVPDTNKLNVVASVVPSEGCAPVTFNFTATPSNAVGTVNYKWTKGTSTTSISNASSFSRTEVTEAGQLESQYIFNVEATDLVTNCKAHSSVQVSVYDSLPIPNYEVVPNDRCLPTFNGIIRLIDVPKGYTYELFNGELVDAIRTQIPAFDSIVPTTSIIFDELQGNITYMVKITTIHGCVTRFDVFVPDSARNPEFNEEVTVNPPTHCDNSNGQIVIVPEAGYEYHVFSVLDPDNEIPASSYNNLPSGYYEVYKYNVRTACDTSKIFYIPDSEAGLTFPVDSTPNTLCGEDAGNGTIILTQTGVNYVITNSAGDTLYNNVNGVLGGLKMGDYTVYGEDLITHCKHTEYVHISNNTNNPEFTVTPHDNVYCDNEDGKANGYVTVSAAPGSNYTYVYYKADATIVTNVDSLAYGDYYVVATDANGCTHREDFHIDNNPKLISVTPTPTVNSICDSSIAAYDGTVKIKINYFQAAYDYTVILQGVDTIHHPTFHTTTFNHLNSGTYKYIVTDKFRCVDSGYVTVPQAELPPLRLVQTPNTMCEGTFDRPGNGTITVLPPYDDAASGNFAYAYFYAPKGSLEQGDSLHVDYHNLSKTMYHLVDTCYYVTVLDHRTGCKVYDTITVELGRDTLTITGDPTPNKNCIAPFTGSIQWHVTFKRFAFDYSLYPYLVIPDPGYLFSIDGGLTYQTDSLFTGLQEGDYYVTVIDTTTGCVTSIEVPVTVEKTPSDIVIAPTVTPNHACVDSLYDGSISVHATSELFTPAGFKFSFNGGEFGLDTMWTALGAGSYRIIALDTISGCMDSIDVILETENECVPIPHIDSRDFCLNEEGATLTATATLPEECENNGFNYVWFKECHADTLYGSTIPVATDEAGCCLYFVTVTSIATGCKAVDSVNVCVYGPGKITYTVNHVPVDTNYYENCENNSLWIGVVQNGWVNAFWTMNHTTIRPDDEPEYEFFINVPDSIAKYADNPDKWPVSTTILKYTTFCLDVFDVHGCRVQGRFNLVNRPLARETVTDTFCTTVELETAMLTQIEAALEPAEYAALVAGTVTYPYTVTFFDTIERTLAEGCDSIVTYQFTFMGIPDMDADLEDSYCYGVKLSDLLDHIEFTGPIDSNSIKYYVDDVEITDPDYVFAHSAEQIPFHVSFNSGKEDCGEDYSLPFFVDSIPEFTEDLTIDSLCAGERHSFINPSYDCHHHIADSCHIDIIIVDSTDAANPVVEVVVEDMTPDMPYWLYPIKLSYNGKYLGYVVRNECGADTVMAKLIVDTIPVGTVSVEAICADQPLNASWVITNGVSEEGVTATPYVKMPTATDFVELTSTTEIDNSYNGAQLYYVLTNKCGSSHTDTVVMVVNSKPDIHLTPAPLHTCLSDFEDDFVASFGYTVTNTDGTVTKFYEPQILPSGSSIPSHPYILPNGSNIIAKGWLQVTTDASGNQTYTPVTVAQIKSRAFASATGIQIAYYAKNACGSDTAGVFDVFVSDKPEVTATAGTICPTSTVAEVVTVNIDWNNTPGDSVFKAVKSGVTDYEFIDPTTVTFEDLIDYNGGQLLVIAENTCGKDTGYVTLNIPDTALTPGLPKDTCSGLELSEYIKTQPTFTVSNATYTDLGWFTTTTTTPSVTDPVIATTTIVTDTMWIYKKWVTSCNDTFASKPMKIDPIGAPKVSTVDTIYICEGDTIDLDDANLVVTLPDARIIISDTTWTLKDVAFVSSNTYDTSYNNAKLVVKVQSNCFEVFDTTIVVVYPTPEPNVTGKDTCAGYAVDFVATPGYASYVFQLDDETPYASQTSNIKPIVLGEGSHTVTVSVVDEHGCASEVPGSVTVYASNQFGFIFKELATKEETHDFETTTGSGLRYIWMVDTVCHNEDLLVFVEYEFYRDGQKLVLAPQETNLSDSSIQTYIQTQTTNYGGQPSYKWNTKNIISFIRPLPGGGQQPRIDSSLYFGASSHVYSNNSYYGNHFPYTTFGLTSGANTSYYDDVWMHFLAEREVTQEIATFLKGGNYTVVFKLYQVAQPYNYMYPFVNEYGNPVCPQGQDAVGNPLIGGHFFNYSDTTLLVTDSIHITVTGDDFEPAKPVESLSLAPDMTVSETEVAPDMEVWPNPAPAATTTLKARVHNMSGDATVTLTTLGGKQVYEGNVYIDNDNYYFEFNVNSLSVGSYVMTVRTADAIITKKVIVTVLAH